MIQKNNFSPFTCHLSLMPTDTATDPTLVNSPTMHRRLVCKDRNCCPAYIPKNQKLNQNKKLQKKMVFSLF